MRFTKIPLIATLMAVALSLLIVLPTLAQVSGDRTDGRLSVGSWVDVRVADDLGDLPGLSTSTIDGQTVNAIAAAADAYATDAGTTPAGFDAKDTYFNGNLYVSNDDKAYNTILISARVTGTGTPDAKASNIASVLSGPDGQFNGTGITGLGDATTTGPDAVNIDNIQCLTGGVAVASIKNDRSNTTVRAYLAPTGETDPAAGGTTIYQGIVAVWDQEDEVGAEAHSGPCDTGHTDPTRWYPFGTDADEVGDTDNTSNTDGVFIEATGIDHDSDGATPDINDPSNDRTDGWTAATSALIPARDGDTLTISVKGVSGSIRVIVDGDAPEIEDASPASGGTQNKTTVNIGFRVSDDGSGIRYDGESGSSTDADLTPHNGDSDQRFDEPFTKDATGAAMDIQVNFSGTKDSAYNPQAVGEDGELRVTDDDPALLILEDGTEVAADATLVTDVGANNVGLASNQNAKWGTATESSQYGTNGWTQVVKGVTYDLDMRLVGKTFGTYYWQVSATDRVGNKATTDADEDERGRQPFSFKVDDAGPRVEYARTGIGYKAREGEFPSRSWIALNFINGTDSTKTQRSGADRIDSSTVQPGDFTVEGYTVMNALVPSDKKVCVGDDPTTDAKEDAKNITAFDVTKLGDPAEDDEGNVIDDAEAPKRCNFEPRARIYLELSEELGSDELPTIQLLGGILQDIAGNNNETQSLTGADDEVLDKIAPGVSITITSSSSATGRAATDDEGSFTVRVTSDEDLSQFPRLYFATMMATAAFKDGKPGLAGEKSLEIDEVTAGDGIAFTEKENNVWEKKVDTEDIIGDDDDRLLAVIITASDDADTPNPGNSPGWKDDDGTTGPSSGDTLTFKKLDAGGFLVEVDSTLTPAAIEVLPPLDPDADTKNKTESVNPYIQITFSEHNEYGIAVTDANFEDDPNDPDDEPASGTAVAADIGDDDKSATDSHRNVELTSLTLNGDDVMTQAVQVDPWKWVLAVTGLDIGEYELVYSATDDVGNTVAVDNDDATFEFEVLERQPYAVTLQPGWNLISLPGDPFNSAVASVIGDLRADTVLGYQQGEWVTSVKNEDGRWQGTLTEIRGGYGYWVRTTAVETIETVIPPTLPTSNLPTVPIISGWNLVGVVDAAQRPADIDKRVGEDADEYLTILPNWRVAYSFETQLNTWNKLLPDGETAAGEPHMMLNGKGYWLWSSRPGTLVP